MTAEVAIPNRNAVALAADSAVTLGNGKVFNSVNKLFSLSKYHPIGIMIYGDASFCGVPWETVIKMYRHGLGKRRSNTVKGYAEEFLKYLESEKLFQDEDTMGIYFDNIIRVVLQVAKLELEAGVRNETLTIKEILNRAVPIFQKQLDWISSWETRHKDATKYSTILLRKYARRIDNVISQVFGTVPLEARHLRILRRSSSLAVVRNAPQHIDLSAGLVIAGFGEREIYPVFLHYAIGGVFLDRLKFVPRDCFSLTGPDAKSGIIAPFAQSKSAWAFMAGIDPDLHSGILGFVQGLLSKVDVELGEIGKSFPGITPLQFDKIRELLRVKHDEIQKGFNAEVNRWRNDKHITPLMNVVASLPKDEMGALAESLVSLTSYKRRYSPDSETVGGPIDVAVISKGDGFVWIKRKHYFEPQLNPQFFTKYYYEHQEKAGDAKEERF